MDEMVAKGTVEIEAKNVTKKGGQPGIEPGISVNLVLTA